MASPITTINELTPRDQFTANGTQTTFSVGWPVRRTADVVVEFNSGETPDIGYTFSPSNLNDDAGFSVIFNSPPPSGTLITVYRQGTLERLTNYGQQKAFAAAAVNAEFADLMLRMQEMKRDLQRTVRLPASDPAAQLFLPARATRAGKYATYDENGNLSVSGEAPDGDGADSVLELHGLNDDGITDQSAEFEAAIATAVADSVYEWRLTGKGDGTSAIRFSQRVVLDSMPPVVEVSRARFIFDADTQAGIYIRGQQIELPDVGKAKLWTDVDVSGGAVTAFDISVSANPDIVDLLVAGAIVYIRGQNGADGITLDGHSHQDTVVSCVLVSGTRYTLTLTNGLPDTIDGSVWKTEWPDSEHTADPDETLISVLAMAPATANMTDSRTMTIAAGKAAALGLAAGAWVEVRDDATGADTHGTSSESLHRQIVRVQSVVAGTPDTITFDEPVRGALTTAKNARLIMLRHCPQFKFQGPGPAFPIRIIGTPPASPASRRHIFETAYAIRPEITGWFYDYVAADGSTRGTITRDSQCFEPWIHHNGVVNPWPDFAGAFNGGDYYCAWSKGSTRPLIEHNRFLGGRHSVVVANAVGGTVRFNELGYSGFQCLDFHGENEIDVEAYGNRIVRGPKWTDRNHHVAIQAGNQTHTFGTRGALIRDNEIIGFTDAADVGVLIISGCQDIIVDQHFLHPVGIGVQIEADRRAPGVTIERVTIAGSAPAATVGVAIDGRMQVWSSGGGVFGSASRPTYVDDSTGTRRYVTEDEGDLGSTNPEATSGTEVSGDITLTYVGLVADQTVPIQGVSVTANLSQATTELVEYRASGVVRGAADIWANTSNGLESENIQGQLDELAANAAAIPQPSTIDSDGSGAWSPDYDTEIDGYGIVTFARATGDVTAGPLELTWPTMPVGATHNIRFVEAATITAVTRVFTLNCNWSDGAGVGVLEIDEGTKTWDDFAPAIGDTISAGPFGTPTAVAALVSDTVIHTTALPGETGSGDINLTAPADSIQGARTIATPLMDASGVIMVLTRRTASTETSRGEIDTGERVSDYYDNSIEGLLAAETQQDAIDELAVDAAAAAAAISVLQSAGGSDATVDWSIPTPTANGSQVIVITSAHFALSADAGVIKSRIVRILNSNDPANATTVELPKDGVAGTASCVLFFDPTQTGDITLKTTDDAGTVDGATSITIPGGASRFVLVAPIVNSGGNNAAYRTNYDAGASFTGLVSFGSGISNPTITASGALTVAAHSGKTVITSGNITVPSTNGFCCTIIAGGSHTVGAGGATEALTVGQSISVISDGTNVWFTPIITLDTLPTS